MVVNYEGAFEKNVIQGKHFLLNGFAQGRIGTLSTKFSIGCTLMFGKLNSAISNAFLGIAPSLENQKFTFHLYLQPVISTIAYDGTLNGGLIFNGESPYIIGHEQIEKFTFQGNAGIVFSIKSTYLEYFQSTLTKEFTTGGHHNWGGLRIGYLF